MNAVSASTEAAFLGVERSAGGRRWTLRPADERAAGDIARRHDVSDAVARLLTARGVGVDEAADFLDPTLRRFLPDPAHLRDMDLAVARLARAIQGGERVAVFGDYDVDGGTSSALLARFFRALGVELAVYIPDRIKEGYGPNAPALLALRDRGIDVVVTVDCGISAFEPLERAAEAGLDVVVIDHHVAEARLPRASAVVDPNRLDDASPHKQLAAVGVAFLLVVGVNRALREAGWYGAARPEPDLRRWLDLVALGTVCDVVPLTGVNRALVRQGLRVMAERANAGLAALADVAGVNEPPTAFHAGFLLGPRVNAGGRVGQADLGARLLATDDAAEAAALAARLNELNAERRAIEAAVLDAAAMEIELAGEPPPVVVVARDGWHPGVIGIVASRLVERFGRPAFVIGLDGDTGKGSGRSVRGVDLGAAVIAARQAGLLVNGGGHTMAAGLTVARERLPELRAFLTAAIVAQDADGDAGRVLTLDGALAPAAATRRLIDDLERVGPFGAGNAEPRFALTAVRSTWSRAVGTAHVRCTLVGGDGARVNAIAFRAAGKALGALLSDPASPALHVVGTLRLDRWNGREDVTFHIEDAAAAR